jgi:hypothetical protein
MEPTLHLSLDEMEFVASESVKRTVHKRAASTSHRHGHSGAPGFDLDIVGGFGEYAVAKFLGLPWEAAPGTTDKWGDIIPGLQVRATWHGGGRLILHPDDDDAHVFVLAIVELPQVKLAGWTFGEEAKQEKFWDDPQRGRPAFFVPTHELRRCRGSRGLLRSHLRIESEVDQAPAPPHS